MFNDLAVLSNQLLCLKRRNTGTVKVKRVTMVFGVILQSILYMILLRSLKNYTRCDPALSEKRTQRIQEKILSWKLELNNCSARNTNTKALVKENITIQTSMDLGTLNT